MSEIDCQGYALGSNCECRTQADCPMVQGIIARTSLDKNVLVCAGCGATTDKASIDRREGWRLTDATWCPKCAWLA